MVHRGLGALSRYWTRRSLSSMDSAKLAPQATGRFYPHTRAPLTHIHHPNQVRSRSSISDRRPLRFCFSIRHDFQNAPTCSSIWRHDDASVPLETFVAGLTSLLPHSLQMQSYYDLLGICMPDAIDVQECNRSSRLYIKNRAGAEYALFSFWAKTCRVRPPGILSFRHYELLGRPKKKKRTVSWFDPLVLLSSFFTVSSPIPSSSWICSCGQARTRLG